MRLRQAPEHVAQLLEPLADLGGGLGTVLARGDADRLLPVLVERDLADDLRAAVDVDRGVAGDPVQPGAEGDRRAVVAQAPQRRDEDLVRQVLGQVLVVEQAGQVRADPRRVARVQHGERLVVAAAHGDRQASVRRLMVPSFHAIQPPVLCGY